MAGTGPDPKSRLTQHPPGVPGDDRRDDPGDDPRLTGDEAGRTREAKGILAHDDAHRPQAPTVATALQAAEGRNRTDADGAMPSGAGQTLGAGARTLGAKAGGERASAGHGDADRSSRDDGNSLQDSADAP